MICGGQSNMSYSSVLKECHTFDVSSGQWAHFADMLTLRTDPAAVQLDETSFWVTGERILNWPPD